MYLYMGCRSFLVLLIWWGGHKPVHTQELFITAFQFSRQRTGIWIIKKGVSNPPGKRKTNQNQNLMHFQTSIHEACELTSMMMIMMMMFLDGTFCLLLPYPRLKFTICQSLVMHFFFPWQTVRILVTAPASVAVTFISLCRWKCVLTSFSVHYLPCPW